MPLMSGKPVIPFCGYMANVGPSYSHQSMTPELLSTLQRDQGRVSSGSPFPDLSYLVKLTSTQLVSHTRYHGATRRWEGLCRLFLF